MKQSQEDINRKVREYRIKNLQRRRDIENKSKLKLKIEVISHYGNKCKCCGETGLDFLSIDHINGGGTKHRKELPHGSGSMYRWLKENEFPIEYQVLCFNCNFSKYIGRGICMHKREDEVKVVTGPIKFYKTNDPYGFMSNYYKARFYYNGRWWHTTEHAYQAGKCVLPEEYRAIHQTVKANDARLLGQKIKLRHDWDVAKDKIMYECVLAKFLQHPNLRAQLLETGEEELIEDSPVDYYWGCGKDGTGKNMLGITLMKIRKELHGE